MVGLLCFREVVRKRQRSNPLGQWVSSDEARYESVKGVIV